MTKTAKRKLPYGDYLNYQTPTDTENQSKKEIGVKNSKIYHILLNGSFRLEI